MATKPPTRYVNHHLPCPCDGSMSCRLVTAQKMLQTWVSSVEFRGSAITSDVSFTCFSRVAKNCRGLSSYWCSVIHERMIHNDHIIIPFHPIPIHSLRCAPGKSSRAATRSQGSNLFLGFPCRCSSIVLVRDFTLPARESNVATPFITSHSRSMSQLCWQRGHGVELLSDHQWSIWNLADPGQCQALFFQVNNSRMAAWLSHDSCPVADGQKCTSEDLNLSL